MASILLHPACLTQCRACSVQFASPSCRTHRANARCGRRRIVKVQGANTASEKLTEVDHACSRLIKGTFVSRLSRTLNLQIQDALRLKQVRLQQLVKEESFQQVLICSSVCWWCVPAIDRPSCANIALDPSAKRQVKCRLRSKEML